MSWFRQLLGPHTVLISEPYSDENAWLYICGDENNFKLRRFTNAAAAYEDYTAMLTGLSFGNSEISIRLVRLDERQARALARAKAT
jgi:hypothetical protein